MDNQMPQNMFLFVWKALIFNLTKEYQNTELEKSTIKYLQPLLYKQA